MFALYGGPLPAGTGGLFVVSGIGGKKPEHVGMMTERLVHGRMQIRVRLGG